MKNLEDIGSVFAPKTGASVYSILENIFEESKDVAIEYRSFVTEFRRVVEVINEYINRNFHPSIKVSVVKDERNFYHLVLKKAGLSVAGKYEFKLGTFSKRKQNDLWYFHYCSEQGDDYNKYIQIKSISEIENAVATVLLDEEISNRLKKFVLS